MTTLAKKSRRVVALVVKLERSLELIVTQPRIRGGGVRILWFWVSCNVKQQRPQRIGNRSSAHDNGDERPSDLELGQWERGRTMNYVIGDNEGVQRERLGKESMRIGVSCHYHLPTDRRRWRSLAKVAFLGNSLAKLSVVTTTDAVWDLLCCIANWWEEWRCWWRSMPSNWSESSVKRRRRRTRGDGAEIDKEVEQTVHFALAINIHMKCESSWEKLASRLVLCSGLVDLSKSCSIIIIITLRLMEMRWSPRQMGGSIEFL